MVKKNYTNLFIERSKINHNNKYDYSLVEYKNARTKVKIKCPEHGDFDVTPDSHLRLKSGCPKCNGGIRLTTNEFIEKSNIIHNKKYDYSLTIYKNNHTKVKIKCPEHGVFHQKPMEHMTKCGCQKCGVISRSIKKQDNLNTFIDKAKKIHGDNFDYSLVIYKDSYSKVKIVCKKHGIFLQIPNSHLRGSGCPHCQNSSGENKIKMFLDKNNVIYISQKKFNDCRHINKLPFDFFLNEFNLCIEYDGQHHYVKNHKWCKGEYFDLIKKRDQIKTNYCNGKNNRPKLIRIPYWEKINIESILDNILNKQNEFQ